MSSPPWQIKRCQTALAGWAQLRHTWMLQSKPNIEWLGGADTPPGFVEPEPEFYNRLAALVELSERLLDKIGALETDREEVLSELREAAAVLDTMVSSENNPQKAFAGLSQEEKGALRRCSMLFDAIESEDGRNRTRSASGTAQYAAKLKSLLRRLEKGEKIEDEKVDFALKQMSLDIRPLWRKLGALCRRLETLSHKQLRSAFQ